MDRVIVGLYSLMPTSQYNPNPTHEHELPPLGLILLLSIDFLIIENGVLFYRIRGDQQHFVRRDELKV
jgi:hypothetical protein